MKKFNFSLATLHRYRGTLEEVSMREFAVELKRLSDGEKSLRCLCDEKKRLSEEMESIKEKSERRLELSLYTTYMTDLKAFIKEKEAQVEECRKEVEKKRRALIEVMKERKVLDVMKERSLEEHRAENTRLEQKVLDDVAGARFYMGGGKNES